MKTKEEILLQAAQLELDNLTSGISGGIYENTIYLLAFAFADWESGGNDGEVLGTEDECIWCINENNEKILIENGKSYLKS